jgi:putative spermidine/putrescine transport system substrate-binding protein
MRTFMSRKDQVPIGKNPVRRPTRRTIRLGAVGLAVALLAAACGGDEAVTTEPAGGDLVEPATKPDRLIVRTWGDPWQSTYAEGPAATFTAKTGIPVEFDVTDYNEIQAKVQQAVSAGQRPPVDVVLSIESNSFRAAAQGISAPLDTRLLTNLNQLSSVAMPAGVTNYVNVSTYSQPIVYDPSRVDLPMDTSWEEIFDGKYEGRVFVTSTPDSLLFPVAEMLGLDVATDDLTPAFDKIAELAPNIVATGDEEEFIAGIESGEFDLGITLVATALEIGGLAWVVPREGITVQLETLWVPAGLPDDVTYWATVFVNEVLSAENQSKIAEFIGEVPVNLNASIPDFMIGDPAFPFTEEDLDKYALVVSAEVVARNKDAWQAAYSAAIQK